MPRQKYRELRSRAVVQDPCAGPVDLPAFDPSIDADLCMMDLPDAMTWGQEDDVSVLLTNNEALDTLLWNAGQDAVNSSGQGDRLGLTPGLPLTWDTDIAGFNPPMNLNSNNNNHSETASPMSQADSLGLTDFSLSPDSLDTPI
ncbi:hypothetical protein V8C26DRAFT_38852 [Trichoderma gracile]